MTFLRSVGASVDNIACLTTYSDATIDAQIININISNGKKKKNWTRSFTISEYECEVCWRNSIQSKRAFRHSFTPKIDQTLSKLCTAFGFSVTLNTNHLILHVIHYGQKSFDPRLITHVARVWSMKRLFSFLGFRLNSNIYQLFFIFYEIPSKLFAASRKKIQHTFAIEVDTRYDISIKNVKRQT